MNIPNPALVVLIGVPGSGKSKWAAANFMPTQIVSSDALRAVVCDDEDNQDASDDAFFLFHAIIGRRLARGCTTVADATNVKTRRRRFLLDIAEQTGVPAIAVIVDPGVEVAKARNAARSRVVPDFVIDSMRSALDHTMTVIGSEPFEAIYHLDNGADSDVVTRLHLVSR